MEKNYNYYSNGFCFVQNSFPSNDSIPGIEDDEEDFFSCGEGMQELMNMAMKMANEEDDDDDKKPSRPWNLITAFNAVLKASAFAHGKVQNKFSGKEAVAYLRERLNMTEIQVIVIAHLIDEGKPMTWRDLARKLDVSRLSMMTHADDMNQLVREYRWLRMCQINKREEETEAFVLVSGVIENICKDKIFEPEPIHNLDDHTLVERLASFVDGSNRVSSFLKYHDLCMMHDIVKCNPELPLAKTLESLKGSEKDKHLLLYMIADYGSNAAYQRDGLDIDDIKMTIMDIMLLRHLRFGDHILMEEGWIENSCEHGMVNPSSFQITQKAKDELIPGFKLLANKKSLKKAYDRDLIKYDTIKAKDLYYNAREQKQVDRLRHILSQDNFSQVQQRLIEEGLRTGVAVLLNGGPGTGKTELVRQLARETERDLLMIDISQVKDKFVGESEKNTKAIFERYKRLCEANEVKPILFINECDAILGKRLQNVAHSSDKMLNSMQNILLQQLEDFEGILICTTNMAECGLDDAFMRRFLVKINFDKPDNDARSHIWQSMLSTLTDDEARLLASRYDFSGGQCENVKRKATIERIINGTPYTFELIDSFCKEEMEIQNSSKLKPVAGFCV